MDDHSRREFFRRAAVLGGAIGASQLLPRSIQKALAIEPEPGTSYLDAEHVVILMQENRSFDHSYGSLQGVRGFNDPRAITLPDGNPSLVQTDDAGQSHVPFRLNLRDTRSTWMGYLPHNWMDQVDARHGGLHDRWLQNKRSANRDYAAMPLTLGYYTREDIPFYYELADAFTICDQHFCSTLTGTTPNRLHLWTGAIREQQSADSPARVFNHNCQYGTEVSWPTFPEQLQDAGVSWKIYQNELRVPTGLSGEADAWLSNLGCNPIEWFTQYHIRFAASRRRYLQQVSQSLAGQIERMEKRLLDKNLSTKEAATLNKELAKARAAREQVEKERQQYSDEAWEKLSPREQQLHERAFTTNSGDPAYRELAELTYEEGNQQRRLSIPKGDLLYQFREDVQSGKLPTVSWLVPPERLSDHPHSAWYGAWYIAEVFDILTQNPEVWKKTIFILTYDENDGFFDHVPPFVAPNPHKPETGRTSADIDASADYVEPEQQVAGTPAADRRSSPMGLGYRVPMVIASPWSRGGCVCSQVFDHTSSLQFMEKWLSHKTGKKVRQPNISSWRRAICGDLTAAFQAEADQQPVKIPFPPRDEFLAGIHEARYKQLPSGFKPLSAEELESIRKDRQSVSHFPRQEPGVRRSSSLPYELAVEGALGKDRQSFEISLAAGNERFGAQAAGAPFIVYARHGAGQVGVRNYAVSAGDKLSDAWALKDFAQGRYHLTVQGPNGFFREFQGTAEDPQVSIELHDARDAAGKLSGDVELHLENPQQSRVAIEVVDGSYGNPPLRRELAAGERAVCVVPAGMAFGWYDLRVRADGHPQFEIRYAGRVETGRWSYSDPAMGRVSPAAI